MSCFSYKGSSYNEHAVLERSANNLAGLYKRPDLADNIDNIRSENNISISDSTMLNTTISKSEVQESIMNAKRGKATGIDEIPVEVLNNTTAVAFLVSLFQACFASGVIPEEWTERDYKSYSKIRYKSPPRSIIVPRHYFDVLCLQNIL